MSADHDLAPPPRDHVVVCGLGGLGWRIVEQLHHRGEPVVVVDRAPDPARVRVLADRGVAVVEADATLPGSLEVAGLAGARAVVCVEDGDAGELRNLHVALQVREHRPGLRVVTAIGNAAIGRAVADDPGPGSVLDVADLVTPALVEACLRSPVHALDVAGSRFVAVATTAPAPGTLRSLYGDLAPLAVTDSSGAVHVCPSRDHPVGAGEAVTLLGTGEEIAAAAVDTGPPSAPRRRAPTTRRGGGYDPDAARGRAGPTTRTLAVLTALGRESDRGLRWALVALLGLLVVSTAVISLGYRYPDGTHMAVVDALYFTVESVATVGFGDFSFADQHVWLRLWAVFLMLAGIVTTAIPIAFFTDMLISRRLSATAGRRAASAAVGHVVIVGLGAVGVSVLEALAARGRDVVVVEADPRNRHLPRARTLGVPVVFGDATTPAVLRDARVPQAAAVAVLTSDDMANIETGLAVRDVLAARWDDVPVVLRLFDRELGRTVAARFGFGAVRSIDELAAPWFVGAALGLDVLGTFPVHGHAFLLGRLRVEPGSGLDGLAMRDLSLRTRVIALRRAAADDPARHDAPLEHPPRRDTRFAAGDQVFLVGPDSELLEVLTRSRTEAPDVRSPGGT
ncbi:NAD-binding protein [Actinomycetospora termitidis]|uniref:NAD-binding protein n=1 Tax=Actinomycetospora termitidis TaxID=3053470 RepID=A0ABT7M6X7_9PSEU|nr:NAD-binding protein [Actinomycetospora sp. Odt1-22]MDL5155552.1 NAD-binding protein [Actinomycetospora sp. Odt1-22]